MKLWGGRFVQATDTRVDAFTASIQFDQRLAMYDIAGSMAHAEMLGACGIIGTEDAKAIVQGLSEIRQDLEAGNVEFRVEDEDVHMNIERLLHERIGPVAGKLHTARSRNDQVALDMHLFLMDAADAVKGRIRRLQQSLVTVAQRHLEVVVPGYTHLQRAQPILFAHHLLAYFWMLERDMSRMDDLRKRANMMPLGAGALAGTTFPIDREQVMEALGFSALYENSLDAVSDRDYLAEFLSGCGLVMAHLSRLAEEMILWSSEEFGWIELADAYCTGSSMMPQKKNPDVAELVRGKTGRVYGHWVGLMTVLKGLPLAYNKDLQEDKEGIFDVLDTVLPSLELFSGMIETMKVRQERLAAVFDKDFSNATDVADYLVGKGVPFRKAHEIVGKLVLTAIETGVNLASLPFRYFQEAAAEFEPDIYEAISVHRVVNARNVRGGTAQAAVLAQLELARKILS